MKVRQFGIFAAVIGMFCGIVAYAQKPSVLPQSPAIKSSIFPNGMSCYVAENVSSKGVADITLIRRDYEGNELLSVHKNVDLSSEASVDSLLLNIMRRVDDLRVSSDCAVIISGDVKAETFITKLKYMSLMVDSSAASAIPEYHWDGAGKVDCAVSTDTLKGHSTIRFMWQTPRIPMDRMNTTQSAVYEKAAWEMGEVACRWIRRSLRRQDIPFAEVSCHQADLIRGFSHGGFTFTVKVAQHDTENACMTVASVLSSIGRGEFCQNDLSVAQTKYLLSLERSARRTVIKNDTYTQVCRNAFLYNRPLATEKELHDFFTSKDISISSRNKIFGSISSALIDMDQPSDSVRLYASGVMLSDTLGLPGMSFKTKVKTSRNDAFSGGVVWTFENGFKVIYRKMSSTDRKLYYSMLLNGGFGNIVNLERGEGAYMSDYIDLCWIAGMKGSDFKDVLSLAGMTMDTGVSMFSTNICGQVENRNVSLLMKALLAVVNESRPDESEIDYFSRCENLKLAFATEVETRAMIDSLLCPGYKYTPFKTGSGVGEETFAKAETLFSSLTSKMNDGVLVLIGDMDESEVKKVIQMYAGKFKVKNIASRRHSMQYHPVSGWSAYSANGNKDMSFVVMSTPLAMNTINHFASEIAAEILERRIKDAFEPDGIPVSMMVTRSLYPDERFSVYLKLSGKCTEEDLHRIKVLLSDCENNVTDAELKSCKEYIKNKHTLQKQTVGYWLRAIPLRHLEGKDFTTGIDAKIDAVSKQALQQVFRSLGNGAGIEYTIIKNNDN